MSGGNRLSDETSTWNPEFTLADAESGILWKDVFGDEAPVEVDIGCGKGRFLMEAAQAHPEIRYLGVEKMARPFYICRDRLAKLALSNVRIVHADGQTFVARQVPAESVSVYHVYFPDPWPKKRHHKRRLIQPDFVHALALRLAPGGYLHCATDWEEYAQQMLEVLSAEPLLKNSADGFAARPDWRPQTKFEARGLRLGHGVRDVVFLRHA